MIVPDSNLLLYAYNPGAPKHQAALLWWNGLLAGTEPIGLVHPAIFSFIRLSTHPSAFPRPLSLKRASEFVDAWLERRSVNLLLEDRRLVATVVELLTGADSTGGNLVVDAQIAAIAKAHNATVHTADRDFRRFPGVKVHYPLDAGRLRFLSIFWLKLAARFGRMNPAHDANAEARGGRSNKKSVRCS